MKLDANTRSELSFAIESFMQSLDRLDQVANSHVAEVTLDGTAISIMRNEALKFADTLDHLHDLATNDLPVDQSIDLVERIDQTESILQRFRRSISTELMTAGSLAAYIEDLEEAFTCLFNRYLVNGARYV